MSRLFDSHAHYFDERFADEFENAAHSILPELFEGDIEYIVNVGTNNENNRLCLEMARQYDGMYAAVGIHPTDCRDYGREEIQKFEDFLIAHRDFKKEKIVAIGEIGFDYHWEPYDKDKQIAGFIKQIELANSLNLPISVHSRDATENMINLLRTHKLANGGVMHCFSGSRETAKILLDLGFYISFAGTLTFKNARNLVDVAEFTPLDRCLTETDSPYLAPVPHRGEMNTPAYVPFVTKRLAEIKNIAMDEVAKTVKNNAKTLFYKLK